MAGPVYIFDLDRTLVRCNSSFRFCLFLYFHRRLQLKEMVRAFVWYFKYRFQRISLQELHEEVFEQILKGKSSQVFQEQALPFVQSLLRHFLYSPVASRLTEALKSGYRVILMSSSPDFLVGAMAKQLGVHEWVASEYEIGRDGTFQKIRKLVLGKTKAFILKTMMREEGFSSRDVTVFSDSIEDLPLLELAHTPVAVRPERALKKVAFSKCWQQI